MKKEYLILIAVILALGAYLLLKDKNQTHFKLPEIAAMESAKTDAIQIIQAGRTIDLKRKDDRWFIQPGAFPADGTKVKNMLKAAEDLQITALVSESANYERYDLSDDKRTTVKLSAGDTLQREFEIGRAAPTFQHTFVKLTGDANVYHAKGSLNNTFNIDQENLRDRIVLTYDQAAVTSIDLQKGDQMVTLLKKEIPQEQKPSEENEEKAAETQPPATTTVWQTSDGEAVDQTAVERLLGSFSHLQCDGFVADKSRADFKEPAWELVFKTGQETYTVAVKAKAGEADDHLEAISSASDYVFKLLQSRAENFEKQVHKLMGLETEEKK